MWVYTVCMLWCVCVCVRLEGEGTQTQKCHGALSKQLCLSPRQSNCSRCHVQTHRAAKRRTKPLTVGERPLTAMSRRVTTAVKNTPLSARALC